MARPMVSFPAMEPQVSPWNLVIKVKYGDILKRFNVYVEGHRLDHNMTTLRTKIINAFKFRSDVDLTLTYTDEDGDIVILDDDDDLRDAAVCQQLNPLRINVQLKYAGLELEAQTADPTPVRSVNPENQLVQISSSVDDALKSLPEPFRSTVSNLSHDLFSKVASAAPAFSELMDALSKLNISRDSRMPNSVAGDSFGSTSGQMIQPMNMNVNDELVPNNPCPISEQVPSIGSTHQAPEDLQKQSVTDSMMLGEMVNTPVDLNIEATQNPCASLYPDINDLLSPSWTNNTNVEHKETRDAHVYGKSVTSATLFSSPADPFMDRNFQTEASGSFLAPSYMYGVADVMGNERTDKNIQLPTGTASLIPNQASISRNSFMESNVPSPKVPFLGGNFSIGPPRISGAYCEDMLRTFHRGIRCDGCGLHPIVGSRYKSIVKENYDLCSICFSQMGNEADYTRIDRVSSFSNRKCPRYRSPSHGYGMRPKREKLESQFIQDVTILDGSLMAPSTLFTKIWRMRNNGTAQWPYGTQLVWIGGDEFASQHSIQLEIPVSGFPVNEEIDIAVDFMAPSRPGRYISYWKLASPSGQKFGQRVWVFIQVDQPCSSSGGVRSVPNLNLPPVSSAPNETRTIDVNADPLDEFYPEPSTVNISEELVKPLVDDSPRNILKPSVDEENIPPMPTVQSVVYPIIEFPPSSSTDFPVASVSSPEAASDGNLVEDTLLKELEEMGFKQIELNKEILRLNDYNLEQSVDDLCGFAEWGPLLAELQEMGFYDKEKNKKLLVKYGGSIKRVVLDLIAGEKAE
ncbi:protein JOKA2 isoform X1 [Typha angustifolia]|uniref:protein JOKA2 isoform X1 n=1 Tax=Typha angustifolia TaxID=59011 RepID=UPI003C2CCF5D